MSPDPDPTKPLIKALHGEPQEVPPIWLMRQAGRYLPEYRELRGRARDFLHFCYTPELAVEATLQPIRRFAMDGAIIFSDILVIPDALGQEVGFETGRGPVLSALSGREDIDRLSLDRLDAHLAPVYDALRLVRGELPPATALIGFAGAPWTLATYMIEGGSSRDFMTAKSWLWGREQDFDALMDMLVDAVSRHLSAQVEAGAEVLQIFDSWAGILPEGAFRKYTVEPVRRIVTRVKEKHPTVPIIGFPNRAGVMYEPFVRETGVDAVSIDAMVPPRWAAAALQGRACIQGNLDPALLVLGGQKMRDNARAIVKALAGGAHVFNLGHGVVPETPPDHVAELVDVVREGTP